TQVTCVFSQSCILPCNVHGSSDPVIHWTHLTSDSNVHSYYDGRDQLEYQNQNFRGRTSLFKDQIATGNASLLLKGAKVQDEGTYRCHTSTISGNKQFFIHLKVEAPVSKVSISQEENRIICSSERIYPQPELTWSTIPPSNTRAYIMTTVQQTEERLYSVSSSLMVSDGDPDLIYSCTIKTRTNKKRATYKFSEKQNRLN
ncbi:hypothetical protein GOODEAATRI_031654, partial [Goodea atripinnis]